MDLLSELIGDRLHPEVLRRSEPLLHLLVEEGMLTPDHLLMVRDAAPWLQGLRASAAECAVLCFAYPSRSCGTTPWK